MSPEQHRRLQQAASPELALTVLDFTPRLYEYLTAADLVVSMGGYNTVVEILTANQRGSSCRESIRDLNNTSEQNVLQLTASST